MARLASSSLAARHLGGIGGFAIAITPLAAAQANPSLTSGFAAASFPCPVSLASRPLPDSGPIPTKPNPSPLPGYAAHLRSTPFGWPVLPGWCVWVEPADDNPAPQAWELPWIRRWQEAVAGALSSWTAELPIRLVDDPNAAQVRVWRRNPPLAIEASGRSRASHGRSLLRLLAVERHRGDWRLEPSIDVLIGPGQRAAALQATALHELGHAFGLWGHSDDQRDAMAGAPGAVPVLQLTPRDRATLRWLRGQPNRFGEPPPEAGVGPQSPGDTHSSSAP